MVELGRIQPPYGGRSDCASASCQRELTEEVGAFLFNDLETNKLIIFCGTCAVYVELNRKDRWVLVAL